MTEQTTQRPTSPGRDPAPGADRRSAPSHRAPTRGLVSLLAGAAGVVAAVLPSLGLLALALAALAIGAGVPAMRRGPAAASFALSRTGVVLGMIAVLLGFLSLAMQLLG